MATRKILKKCIKAVYGTQDRCAYALGINNATLSRIVNCTLDPNAEQVTLLCTKLNMNEKEVNLKDDE